MPRQPRFQVDRCVLILLATLVGCSEATPPTPLTIARQLHHDADWAGTVEQCNIHLSTAPDDVEALLLRGRSYMAIGQLDDALSDLDRVVELTPEKSEPLYIRAMIYRKLGNDELAMVDRDNAVARDPNYQAAYEYSPSNFARPINLDLVRQAARAAAAEEVEQTVGDSQAAEGDEPYASQEPYALEEVPEPYSSEALAQRTAENAEDNVASATGDGESAGESPHDDAPGQSKPIWGLPGAQPIAQVPVPHGANEPDADEAGETDDNSATTPRVPTQTYSSALPPGYVSASPQHVTTGQPGLSGPRSTGIQSNPGTATTQMAPFLGLPLGQPIATNPTALPGTTPQNLPPQNLPRAPFVPAPTGRRGSSGFPSPVTTALPNSTTSPSQTSPQTPYTLHANPIPGQAPSSLSTSISPPGPQPQGASRTTEPTLSTARPTSPPGGN